MSDTVGSDATGAVGPAGTGAIGPDGTGAVGPAGTADDGGNSGDANHLPTVVALHVAPGRRLPTKPVDSVVAEAGKGLVGDRYHGSRHRHVTIQSQEGLAAAAADLGRPVDPGLTRRNVTISHGEVPTAPGTRLRIGDALLEVVRVAAPCRLLDDALGPGAAAALRRRAGTVFRVLESGTVAVGDVVRPDAGAEHDG